jgi:hypothetical protein
LRNGIAPDGFLARSPFRTATLGGRVTLAAVIGPNAAGAPQRRVNMHPDRGTCRLGAIFIKS